jgi:hypothetical protein
MRDILDLHIHVNIDADITGFIRPELFNELAVKDKIFQEAYYEFRDVVNKVYEEVEENRVIDNIVHHCLTGK